MFNILAKIITTSRVVEVARVDAAALRSDGKNLRKTIQALYGGRSLRIRHVDAGSTNAEEYEMTALGNAFYDIERFGISFVASPRHADVLTVSGPVTRNMEHALRQAYEMTPNPKIVIAVGDGAINGGIWKGSYAVVGGVKEVIPVDFEIPGDPPTPADILNGILSAIQSAQTKKKK